MSFHDDRDGRRRRKPDIADEHPSSSRSPGGRRRADGDIGNALRRAYERVVDEDIPPEMLDLLGKLG